MSWGGGLSGNVSVWGVENRISVSLQAIKVGEAPERSQGCKGEAPSACMQPGHDGTAAAHVTARWIIMRLIKHQGGKTYNQIELRINQGLMKGLKELTGGQSPTGDAKS